MGVREEKMKMQEGMKEERSRRAGKRRMEEGEEIRRVGGKKAEESGERGEERRRRGESGRSVENGESGDSAEARWRERRELEERKEWKGRRWSGGRVERAESGKVEVDWRMSEQTER